MKKDKQRGITLVALVITIIILLILAGISISSLTGNGLFEKAKLAKEKTENAQEKENETLGEYKNKIEGYINSNRETEEFKQFKKIIAEAITKRGIETNENDSAEVMAHNIESINGQDIEYPYIWGGGNACAARYEFAKIRNKKIYLESSSTIYIRKGSDPGSGNTWVDLYNTSGYIEISVEELIMNYDIDVNTYPYLTFQIYDYDGYNMLYAK